MKRFMRRPQPATLISMLALMVALGGTSYGQDAVTAAKKLINGKNIKNGTITSGKLKKGTIKADRLAPGVIPAAPDLSPFAKKADKIASATHADTADNATNAANAGPCLGNGSRAVTSFPARPFGRTTTIGTRIALYCWVSPQWLGFDESARSPSWGRKSSIRPTLVVPSEFWNVTGRSKTQA